MANTITGTPFLDILLCAYPLYCSAVALKSNNKEKITQFMTYWMLFAVFTTVENLLISILQFIPFYFVGRRLFCIWCVLPIRKNGGTMIYKTLIDRFFNEVNQGVQIISLRSLERVIGTAEDLRQKVNSKMSWDAVEESSESTSAARQLVRGLEQLRDKTEPYRSKVLNQMLISLRGAVASREWETKMGMDSLDEEEDEDEASASTPPQRPTASAVARGLAAYTARYPSCRIASARAFAHSLSPLPPRVPSDLYASDDETASEDLAWT